MSTAGKTLVAFPPMRAAIAKRMAQSNAEIPQFSVSVDVGLEAAYALVDEINREGSIERATVTSVLVSATAATLARHPSFNARWEGGSLYHINEINPSIAIAVDDGLVSPAILNADKLTVAAANTALRDLVNRAHTKRLRPAELSEGTFTLSNLGPFGVSSFIALVTPPQVAVLAAASSQVRPAWTDGTWLARRVMTVSLSCDHRAVDGVDAARFLATFKDQVEHPPVTTTNTQTHKGCN